MAKILVSTEGPFDFAHLLQVSNSVYKIFHGLKHVYIPWARADNTQGQRFDGFIRIYFMVLYIYIALGRQGQTTI